MKDTYFPAAGSQQRPVSLATSPDGTRIAYDRAGSGPAILLLHGGGGSRQEWHQAGYVQRLLEHFTVVALDLRGHGESDLPVDPAAYTIEKLEQDILAVADACGIERFALWGMSYGGKVGRYLALHSERVQQFIMLGTPLGLGVSGKPRQEAIDFCDHWLTIIRGLSDCSLELASLTPADREMLSTLHIPAMTGWVRAMLDWPEVAPPDFRCPTLYLLGSEDQHAMQSLREYETSIPDSLLKAQVVVGLDHDQLFDQVDRVLPLLLSFTIDGYPKE
jgi:pimeloyl-ACP methyl ester carboxylesterase